MGVTHVNVTILNPVPPTPNRCSASPLWSPPVSRSIP